MNIQELIAGIKNRGKEILGSRGADSKMTVKSLNFGGAIEQVGQWVGALPAESADHVGTIADESKRFFAGISALAGDENDAKTFAEAHQSARRFADQTIGAEAAEKADGGSDLHAIVKLITAVKNAGGLKANSGAPITAGQLQQEFSARFTEFSAHRHTKKFMNAGEAKVENDELQAQLGIPKGDRLTFFKVRHFNAFNSFLHEKVSAQGAMTSSVSGVATGFRNSPASRSSPVAPVVATPALISPPAPKAATLPSRAAMEEAMTKCFPHAYSREKLSDLDFWYLLGGAAYQAGNVIPHPLAPSHESIAKTGLRRMDEAKLTGIGLALRGNRQHILDAIFKLPESKPTADPAKAAANISNLTGLERAIAAHKAAKKS